MMYPKLLLPYKMSLVWQDQRTRKSSLRALGAVEEFEYEVDLVICLSRETTQPKL